MSIADKEIERLMREREEAKKAGHRQNENDSLYLLSLLLNDAVTNPQNYVRR